MRPIAKRPVRPIAAGYRWMRHRGIADAWIYCHLDSEGRCDHALLNLTHGHGEHALLLVEAFWKSEP